MHTRNDTIKCGRCAGTGNFSSTRYLVCFKCNGTGMALTAGARRIRDAEAKAAYLEATIETSDVVEGMVFTGKRIVASVGEFNWRTNVFDRPVVGQRFTIVADDASFQTIQGQRDRVRVNSRWRTARSRGRIAEALKLVASISSGREDEDFVTEEWIEKAARRLGAW